MKHTIIFSTLISMITANAYAVSISSNQIRDNIAVHSHAAKSGVIVAVTERGAVAADTAWLLSKQVKPDNGYTPMLLALKPDEKEVTLKTLHLAENELPALIFYDGHGQEINRIVGVLPTNTVKQTIPSNSIGKITE